MNTKPDSSFLYELILGNGKIMIIQFSEESEVYLEEEFMGFDSYECWDDDDTRYILYCDSRGYSSLKTTTIDGDIIHFEVENITKLGLIEE